MMMNKTIVIAAVLIVAVGVAGFFAGMQYQKMQRRTFNGAIGTAFGRSGNTAMRPVFGNVVSADAKSITVQMPDGSSKIVIISSSTAINKAATGTIADLQKGTRVAVFGQNNSDGSVTAQSVQINPQMRGVRPTQ